MKGRCLAQQLDLKDWPYPIMSIQDDSLIAAVGCIHPCPLWP